jgi:opacity protein-like surface antigen
MKRIIFAVVVCAFAVVFIQTAQAEENEKSNWYIGFGLGTGNGGWTVSGNSITMDEWAEGSTDKTTVTIDFGVGAILNPSTHIGFDGSAIRRQISASALGYDITANVQINNYLAMLTFSPTDSGFFLHGGAGVSVFVLDLKISGIGSDSESASGFAGLAGLGYAFWLGESFNLGLNFDYSYQSYRSNNLELDDSHFWNVYVSFYWF